MLFCAFVATAWAQLVETSTEDAPKYYLLGSYNRGGYLTNAGVDATLKHVDIVDASYWYFEKANDNGGVYIVNKVKDNGNKVYASHNRKSSTTPEVWYILENGVNKLGVSISTTNPISNSSCIDANNHNDEVGSWAPNASDWNGTTWTLWTLENYNNIIVTATSDATYNPNGLSLRTRADRLINSISLVGSMGSATVALDHGNYMGNGLVYLDKTSTTIKVVAGEELTASVATGANWMNTFAYIDTDGTPGFSASIADDGFTPAGDLVSYSFYSGDETNGDAGKNSAGTELTGNARNTKVLPAFKAPSTPGTYRMRIKLDWNSINPNGGNANFMPDGGSFVDVTLEVVDPNATIDVVYNFVYGGETKYTQTSAAQVGEEYPEITVANQFVYGVSAVKPTGVIEEGDVVEGTVTKTIELTDNLPFVAAADYASIKNWYYIQMHSSGGSYSRYIQAMDGYIEWLDVDMNASDVDSYTWGFIGNPFDGFKLVNYANGNTKGVNANASADPVINPAMGDIATATAWTLKPSASNPTAEYFCFQYPGSNKYMNAQSGKIAFWGSADEGSTMWVTERDLSGATELQAVIDQVEAFVEAGVANGTTVGYITSESVANVATVLQAAKEAVASKTGCVEAQIALQEAVATVETIQPEEGKFYTIQNSYTNSYMNVNNSAGLVATTAVGIGEVFQFVKENGNLYLKNVERGTYLNTALAHAYGQNSAAAIETENAKAVTISNLGKANQVSITPNGGATLHHDTNNNNVVAWNAGVDSKSAWIIAEVDINSLAHTLNVTSAEWATLVLGYNAEIPEGVTVYAVSELNENAATLTEVKNTIPAGAAVLINAAEGAYVFNYTESADAIGANLLKGTTVDANIAENAYVLGMIEGVGVGLYTATMNANEGAAFLNNAFKAYLPKTNNAAQTLRFNFGETTGIEGVIENTNANAVIFDLSGRRVAKMQKGIYIVNGKKVYVK